MKIRIILVALLLAIHGLLSAQNNNVILRLNGDARVMHRNINKWEPLNEKDTVGLFDIIELTTGGSVNIMKTSNRTVYTSKHTEPQMVYEIFKKTDDDHMAIMRHMMSEVAANSKAKSSKDYSSYGASVRGSGKKDITATVYAGLYKTTNDYFSGLNVSPQSKDLDFCRLYDNETFSFKIVNHCEMVYYINIVCLDSVSSSFNLCYSFDIPITVTPNEEFVLPGVFQNEDGVKYMLLAYPEEFDSSLLEISIRNKLIPESNGDEECVFIFEQN